MTDEKDNFAFRLLKKFVFLLVLVIILVITAVFGIPRYLGPSNELEKADVIVAISGGDTDARTQEAVRLHQEGWAPNLLFSGAARDADSPSNAEVMRGVAVRAGISSDLIDVEELALDTLGNATKSADIIREKGYKKIILVTSKYHQRRAWLEFRELLGNEVQIINHPAPNDRHWPEKTWWLHPYSLFLGLIETVKTTYVLVDYTF